MTTLTSPVCCVDPTTCCSTTPSPAKIRIEAFYLDSTVCERCRSTLSSLDEALTLLKPILDLAGVPFSVHRIHIDSLALAKRHRFVSSPTIRVNGHDVAEGITENSCQQCGDLCGDQVTCRTFSYRGRTTTELPAGLIVEGVLREWISPKPSSKDQPYEVPENLRRFFHDKG
jgi:hypothetical protein